MMMFDDKVGGWGWLNAEVIKKFVCVLKKKFGIFLKILYFSVYFLLFPYPKKFSQFFSSHWKK